MEVSRESCESAPSKLVLFRKNPKSGFNVLTKQLCVVCGSCIIFDAFKRFFAQLYFCLNIKSIKLYTYDNPVKK